MHTALMLTLVAASVGFVGAALVVPARAQDGRLWYQPPPNPNYQAPDGTYDSLGDFINDVWGIPCGVVCTQAAQARWARYYNQHGRPHDDHRPYDYGRW